MMIKGKKGIERYYLIMIVLAIAGFLAIAISTYYMFTKGEIEREVCHNSVLIKATATEGVAGVGNVRGYVPLKCITQNLCVSESKKGDCLNLGAKFETKKISIAGDNLDEARKAIAEQIAADWAMMGEGKIQVFSRENIYTKRYCVITSFVEFEPELKNKIGENLYGLGEYMAKNKAPEKDVSYWQFLTRGNPSQNVYYRSDGKGFKEDDRITTSNKAIVFIEDDSSRFFKLVGAATGITSGLIIGASIGSVVPIGGTIIGGGAGFIIGAVAGWAGYGTGEDFQEYIDGFKGNVAGIFVIDATKENFKKLECDSFESMSSEAS